MKPGRHLDDGADTTVDVTVPARWPKNLREQLQRRRFASAVRANDAQRFAPTCLERDILKRPEFLIRQIARRLPTDHPPHQRRKQVAQAVVTLASTKLFPDAIEDDCRFAHHTFSANWNSAR